MAVDTERSHDPMAVEGREDGYRDLTVVMICSTHSIAWFAQPNAWMDNGLIDHIVDESKKPVDDSHMGP